MIRYMLDTNACIGVINRNPPALQARLTQTEISKTAISEIVRYELEYGVCHSKHQQKNRDNLDHFLKYIQVLEWREKQSIEAARLRCELAHLGRPIGHYDTLIAAHARTLDACLITHNTREFGRVENLLLEDWESTMGHP